jgi:hypothetical protein
MIIRVGLENNYEQRSLAWALDLPGCFCYGVGPSDALGAMPKAVLGYKAWLEGHSSESWITDLIFDWSKPLKTTPLMKILKLPKPEMK